MIIVLKIICISDNKLACKVLQVLNNNRYNGSNNSPICYIQTGLQKSQVCKALNHNGLQPGLQRVPVLDESD